MSSRVLIYALWAFVLCMFPASGEVLAARITTTKGKSVEQVTAVSREADGLLRIVHAGGVWRISQDELTEESQIALGLNPGASFYETMDDLKVLQTLDGRKFEDIRRCVVTPSEIRFYHSTGSATVRLENLPETLRKRFGYDPAKAASYEKGLAEAREKAEEERLKKLLAVGPGSGSAGDMLYVDNSPPGSKTSDVRKVTRTEARLLAASSTGPWVWVAGYSRTDGTYVPGHYRTSPNGQLADNRSNEGNRDSKTGESGKAPSTSSSSDPVYVHGYFRKDGTYVRPHSRSK
ncbi:hypothetical protein [Luteolibacter soli]|uniref:DUF4412 domain-containing protein n=1 Tax=Luteolibacter soli TaxID=3135280 RepID=A0ABU9AT43_9BACT